MVVRLCAGKVLPVECISTTDLLFLEITPVFLRKDPETFESVWIPHLESFGDEQKDVKRTKSKVYSQKRFNDLLFTSSSAAEEIRSSRLNFLAMR